MYRLLVRPFLFLFDPEAIHQFTFQCLRLAGKVPGARRLIGALFKSGDNRFQKKLFGLTFRNPVGLAAGFDKDARMVDELDSLGFGFIEIGTVTPRPQEGNPKPRLFRLKADRGLINRMGFNNDGTENAALRLRRRKSNIIVGGNIGRNKDTPNERAIEDYRTCFKALFPVVDYFVMNVSSPNTPGLRELQEKEPLKRLLEDVRRLNLSMYVPKPILLKIAPDLSNPQLDDIVDILKETKMDGVVATNTTVSRADLVTDTQELERIGPGGLSGEPLGARSNEVIRYLRSKMGKDFPIIGVGGIMSPEDAIAKLEAGADLIQVYTGFIYEGPGFVKRIVRRLSAH